MSDQPPRLRDAYPYNDSFNAMEVATADRILHVIEFFALRLIGSYGPNSRY